jgi:hypothetical protein
LTKGFLSLAIVGQYVETLFCFQSIPQALPGDPVAID